MNDLDDSKTMQTATEANTPTSGIVGSTICDDI
jgi:hypothetical protein